MDLLIALGVAALLTRAGFALYAVGLVRAKNSAATAMRSIADLCISVLVFWAIGAAILVQTHNAWLWLNPEFLFGGAKANAILFFYMVMILTATSVVSGAVAERCRFFSLCLVSATLAGFVLPAASHVAWNGWLANRGFFDIAGGASLHLAAGAFAGVAAAMVGPRTGKFNRDGSSSLIPGHNLPMASVGLVLLLVGWMPYLAGANILRVLLTLSPASTVTPGPLAGVVSLNMLIATAAAGTASIFLSHYRYGKPDIVLTLSGMLGGMVSLCAGGAAMPQWAAIVTGGVAGIIVPLAIGLIDLRARIDDPMGAIAIHGVGGAWGTIAAGIFIAGPLARSRIQQIGIQVCGVAMIACFSAVVAWILFSILKATVGLRAKEADEFDGLDLAEHDIGAYPDFQQNSIKSYHLREA